MLPRGTISSEPGHEGIQLSVEGDARIHIRMFKDSCRPKHVGTQLLVEGDAHKHTRRFEEYGTEHRVAPDKPVQYRGCAPASPVANRRLGPA